MKNETIIQIVMICLNGVLLSYAYHRLKVVIDFSVIGKNGIRAEETKRRLVAFGIAFAVVMALLSTIYVDKEDNLLYSLLHQTESSKFLSFLAGIIASALLEGVIVFIPAIFSSLCFGLFLLLVLPGILFVPFASKAMIFAVIGKLSGLWLGISYFDYKKLHQKQNKITTSRYKRIKKEESEE